MFLTSEPNAKVKQESAARALPDNMNRPVTMNQKKI